MSVLNLLVDDTLTCYLLFDQYIYIYIYIVNNANHSCVSSTRHYKLTIYLQEHNTLKEFAKLAILS
jgi:hypothetical protein